MKLCLEKELEALKEMTVSQLQRKYGEVFGEPTRAHNKPVLYKRIAWRLQRRLWPRRSRERTGMGMNSSV